MSILNYIASIRGFSTIVACLVACSCAVMVGLSLRHVRDRNIVHQRSAASGQSDTTTGQAYSLRARRIKDLEMQWRKNAEGERVPQASVEHVSQLFRSILSRSELDFASEDYSLLDKPMKRLLGCEQFNYRSGRGSAWATDYFIASCILRAVLQSSADTAANRMATDYYKRFMPALRARIHNEFASALDESVFARWDPSICQLLDGMIREAQNRVIELNGDPLYPGFKKALSLDTEKHLFDECLRIAPIPRYGKPTTMMLTADEDYAQKLKNFASNFIRGFLFYATEDDLRPTLQESTYWGRCRYICSARDGFWPIDVRIMPESAELSNRTVGKETTP